MSHLFFKKKFWCTKLFDCYLLCWVSPFTPAVQFMEWTVNDLHLINLCLIRNYAHPLAPIVHSRMAKEAKRGGESDWTWRPCCSPLHINSRKLLFWNFYFTSLDKLELINFLHPNEIAIFPPFLGINELRRTWNIILTSRVITKTSNFKEKQKKGGAIFYICINY